MGLQPGTLVQEEHKPNHKGFHRRNMRWGKGTSRSTSPPGQNISRSHYAGNHTMKGKKGTDCLR